ncbi:MAG: transcription elongation factor GreB [Pseudomonadota bacterium]
MNKAFTKESDLDEDELEPAFKLPVGVKNYITPQGQRRLQDELDTLWKSERPVLVQTITWAAGNGRLREIDRRIRFLRRRLDLSEVVNPAQRQACEQVFFGATVTVCDQAGAENTYSIVGIDEAEVAQQRISWVSPLAMALLKLNVGDVALLRTPLGMTELEILRVVYVDLP